jgi:pimeloyl-ACP methyl ester carboxylesterase
MLCCISKIERDAASMLPTQNEPSRAPLLILGGYSYGSLITSCLPACDVVSKLFVSPEEDTAEAEIKSRAQITARDLAAYFEMLRNGSIGRGRSSLRVPDATSPTKRSVAMGGYDSEAASRRISRESSRRSLDGERVRRSLDRARQRIRTRVSSDQYASKPPTPPSPQTYEPVHRELVKPEVSYLLVSPLLPPTSLFTTMFSKPTFEKRDSKTGRTIIKDNDHKDQKFLQHPTCFIYGGRDVFTSDRKLRKRADDLHQKASATFVSYEVSEAGHFWVEKGASARLQSALKDWVVTLRRIRQAAT